MIFTTNRDPADIFPRGGNERQRRAIKRRYSDVEVISSLAALGRGGAWRVVPFAWDCAAVRVDCNGPCKSRWLGYFVDREVGAIW